MASKRSSQKRVLVLSGPNLDRLGKREPDIYGKKTLRDIHASLEALARQRGAEVDCRQTNHEGLLVDWIGAAVDEGFDGILLNAGAYTHTSYALYDAIRMVGIPTIEVHISNPDAREPFRNVSTIAAACSARISGFGPESYTLALEGLTGLLSRSRGVEGSRGRERAGGGGRDKSLKSGRRSR